MGLVAHFEFDEESGSVAANGKDSSKNARCVGNCTRSSGQLGRAFGIRNNANTSDWIELPAGIFDGLSATTLAVWLRDLATNRKEAPLFHFSASSKEAIAFIPDDSNAKPGAAGAHLTGAHADASFVDLWSAKPALTDKAWHHVAFSWSAASIELYLDGKSVASRPNPNVQPLELGATSRNYLGRARSDDTRGLFGEIDDLRIYDRVLPAAQIALLYNVR